MLDFNDLDICVKHEVLKKNIKKNKLNNFNINTKTFYNTLNNKNDLSSFVSLKKCDIMNNNTCYKKIKKNNS